MATTAISHIKTTIHNIFFTKSVIWVILAAIFIYSSYELPDIMPMLVGGLGLFLFGMVVMSDGLQAIAGARMRKILTKIVGNRFSGIFTGFTVTAVIQSSSATTVMTVGFVNAKLMTVRQAIGIIIGANIGTTVTAHMIALNLSDYAAPIIGVAVFIVLFAKNQTYKNMGNAILGFGLLFLGMLLMKDAVKPLRTDPFVHSLLTQFNDTPILALLTGMLVTMLIQSSSATEGLIASLAIGGALGADLSTTLNAAIPMLLGSNIGTTITAQIAAITASRNAKRAAMAHTLFNVVGVSIAFILLPFYIDFVRFLVDGFKDVINHEPNKALYLAWAHTTFNILNCLIFLPFIGLVEKICVKLIPQKEDMTDNKTRAFASPISDSNPLPMLKLKAIEKSIINPSADFYIDPAKNAIHRMLNYTKESLSISQYLAKNYEDQMFEKAEQIEDVIDYCQILLNNYIDKAIIAHEKTSKKNTEIGLLHHAVNDIEQIGDISYSLAKRMKASTEFNMKISDEEKQQILLMFSKVMEMADHVLLVIQNGNKELNKFTAKKAYELENSINGQLRDFRTQLRQRPVTEGYGWCIANISDVYSDLENVGDKLKNVLESFGYPEVKEDDELN